MLFSDVFSNYDCIIEMPEKNNNFLSAFFRLSSLVSELFLCYPYYLIFSVTLITLCVDYLEK